LPRNIRTNIVVGGFAAAVLGLGLAIGAGHQAPEAAAPTAPAAQAAAVSAVSAQHAAAAPESPKPESPKPESPKPESPKPESPKPESPKPESPKPVAGLDETQMNNATKIVETAKSMGMSERAQVIALSTAMQESNLHNLASTVIPESYEYTTEGEGSDHDSVGLFQQRQNWGKTKDLMTPEASTRKFLEALKDVPNWEQLPVTVAAQEVQVSAYPDAYAKHQDRATQIVDALNR
jgi:hypothetical protein